MLQKEKQGELLLFCELIIFIRIRILKRIFFFIITYHGSGIKINLIILIINLRLVKVCLIFNNLL